MKGQADSSQRCTSHIKNFKRCLKTAVYRVLCHNGKDYEYYCEHCGSIAAKAGQQMEPLSQNAAETK
jgi:hypothetical protein